MARPRTGQKVTFSVPDDMLKLADLQAEVMGLQRYDVLRMAIAQGLLVLRIQHEIVSDPDNYKKELLGSASGDEASGQALRDKLEATVPAGIERQVKEAA